MQTNVFINVGSLNDATTELIERITRQPELVRGEALVMSALEPCLPSVPKAEPTERYAGIAFDESGKPSHHLFLLAAKHDKKMKWKDAIEWAEGLVASLPTRFESALLYANLRDQFDTSAWYWTSTQFSATGAWNQNFYSGNQNGYGKSYEGLVRAVRRLPI